MCYLSPYIDGKSITDDAIQTCPKEHHVPYGEPKSLPLYVISVLDEQIKKKKFSVRCRIQCDNWVPLGTVNTLREILYKCKIAGPYNRDKKTKYQWYSQFIVIFRGLVINRLLICIY